jgi:uncharacterized protein
MSNFSSWNRRDFLARVMGSLAATPLLGRSELLFGESLKTLDVKNEGNGKPIYRTLGRTGIRLPIVSMGVMNADVPGLIPRSYELGIRHFDTAAVYQQGRNEEMVGRMIKEMGVRDKVIISTKVPQPGGKRGRADAERQRTSSDAETKMHFHEVFEGSLKRLQMDYVDILYNHSADSEADVNSEGTLEAMTALKKEGKVRFIGVSSHHPEMALREVMKLGVYDVVLVPFNFTVANDEGLLTAIREAANKGIGLVAMKTQAGGANKPDPKLGKLTPASQTALLKWVLHHDAITTAIPGFTTYEQLEQNFSVAFSLAYSREEREFLGNKDAVVNAQFCVQCGKCREDCAMGVNIPELMRSHMYAVQYHNEWLAAMAMGAIAECEGLDACAKCESCGAKCRNSVNIAKKIADLKALASSGALRG